MIDPLRGARIELGEFDLCDAAREPFGDNLVWAGRVVDDLKPLGADRLESGRKRAGSIGAGVLGNVGPMWELMADS